MNTRRLGRTGLDVSEIIFGCGAVGGLMINAAAGTRRAAVEKAVAGGINWFDTAAMYGTGKSEVHLGQALRDAGVSPHVSTKIMLDTSDLGDITGQVIARTEAGLARLGRESVDLVQLHNTIGPTVKDRLIDVDTVLKPGGVADAFAALKERGLTRFTGITGLGDGPSCREVIESGRFDTAQVYYNMINPTAARAAPTISRGQDLARMIEAAATTGTGIIVIRAMAAGVLAGTGNNLDPRAFLTADTDYAEEARKAAAVFAALGDAHGTRAQTALRFVLGHPAISCVDIGAATLEQLDEALAAAAMGALPDDALAALDGLYESDFGRV